MIGKTLSDRYLITELLGKGGMATVYKGVDKKLGRTVAIKVIYPGISADPKFAEHFLAEGQNVAALNHPNIVGIYDIGQDDGTQYIVLEFVQGKTLRQVLANGPLPLERALDYGRQLALGLAAAHERGVIHCDIKPENVLITEQGVAKLADFGISRAAASTTVVTGGMIMGTLDYLAPEQIEGKKPDEKTDIYALGLVIYEMLAGTLPFERGLTPAQTLAQRIAADPKPLGKARPGIAPVVESAVMGALHRSPTARYETAAMLGKALTHVGNGTGQDGSGGGIHDAPTIIVPVSLAAEQQTRPRRDRKALLAGVLVLMPICIVASVAAFSAGGWLSPGGASQLGSSLSRVLFLSTATPTLTATSTVTPLPTDTPTPVPTATEIATPTPHVVRQYSDRDEAGNQYTVTQWSNGTYTNKLVVTGAQVQSTAQANENDLATVVANQNRCTVLWDERISLSRGDWREYVWDAGQGSRIYLETAVWGGNQDVYYNFNDVNDTKLYQQHVVERGTAQFVAPWSGRFLIFLHNTWLGGGQKTISTRATSCSR